MKVNKQVAGYIYRAGIYRIENCKNHFKIVGKVILQKKKKKKKNDVTADVAQRESSSIKRYASAFSNI